MRIMLPFLFIALLFTGTVFTGSAQAEPVKLAQSTRQTEKITVFKAKAIKEIDRRLVVLKRFSARIAAIKKLTQDQKTVLTAQVQKEVDALTVLKDKINAATDMASLRKDVETVKDSYRLFAIYVPKIHIITAADQIKQAADTLESAIARLTAQVNELQAQGKDTSGLKITLAETEAKIKEAKTLYDATLAQVLAVKTDDLQAAKKELQSAREKLSDAKKALQTARQNARTIQSDIAKLK